jgi:phage terminase large subunit-like protein
VANALTIDPKVLAGLTPRERDRAEKALLDLEASVKANPLLRYNNPAFGPRHPKQIRFHEFRTRRKAFIGGNQSFLASTEVRMADGSCKPVADIEPGDGIVAVNMDGTTQPAEVLELLDHGKLPTYRWEFGDRGFVATGDHKLLVRTRRGEQIKPVGDTHWTDAIALPLGHEPTYLDPTDSEFAMLFGLILGDGSTFTAGDGSRLSYFYNQDAEIVDLARSEAAAVGLQFSRRAEGHYAFSLGKENGSKRSWWLDKLAAHGLSHPAHMKEVPPAVFLWDNESVARFLAGLFLTDGWVGEANRMVGIQLTSRRAIEQVQDLLETRFGIYGHPIRVRHYEAPGQRDGFTWRIRDVGNIARFHDAIPMVGKKAKLLEEINRFPGKRYDSRYKRQTGLEDTGEQWTFDISIDHPTHLFQLANGMVVSNSGKTTAGIVDDIIQGIDAEMVPDHLKQFKRFRPPFRCRIAAQGREEIEDFIFEKMREWMPPSQLLGGKWKTAYDKIHHVLHLKNGTYYSFKTFQQEAQQWGGSTLDRVHMDEEPGAVHLQEARLRVMRRKGDLLFTMTPVNGLTHMFDEFEAAMEDAQDHGGIVEHDGLGMVIVDMEDNPWLTKEDIEEALRGLSYEERLARKEGKFVAMSGLIYPDFKRELHVVPALERLPGNVNVVVSIDPGIRYACAVGWHYLDANDNMVMFEELYEKDQTIGQICEQIHRINAHYNCQPIYYVIDPAARNRNSQTGRSDQMEFADHGVVTIPGQNSVTAGINRCRERLQSRRFVVTENCTNFLKEIRTYRWKKPPRGEGDGKPVPVKQDDHMMDAFRLCVMSRPWRPEEVIPDNESQMEKLVREHYDAVNRPVESAV